MGLMNVRKMRNKRKKFFMSKKPWKKKKLGITIKFDPLGRSWQAKGIVTKKVQKEAKQPNSAMRKCCRVQLIKNGRQVTAFMPHDGAQKMIDEHDEVIIECSGGRKGGAIGDLSGIRYNVIKVNGQSLRDLLSGKLEKARK